MRALACMRFVCASLSRRASSRWLAIVIIARSSKTAQMTLLLVQNAKVARNGRRPRRLALGDGLKKPVGGRITVDHVKRGALRHAALVGKNPADVLEGRRHLVHVLGDVLGELRDNLHGEAHGREELGDGGAGGLVGLGVALRAEVGANGLKMPAAILEDVEHASAHLLELVGRHGGGADVGGDVVAVRGDGVHFLEVVRKAVDERVDGDGRILEGFGHLAKLGHGHRILHERRDKPAREHFDRLGNLDFTRTGEKLVRAHAAQIGAERILERPADSSGVSMAAASSSSMSSASSTPLPVMRRSSSSGRVSNTLIERRPSASVISCTFSAVRTALSGRWSLISSTVTQPRERPRRTRAP